MAGYWKTRSLSVISQVILDNPNLSGDALRKKISEAYPFNERNSYPYKAWLSAVKETFEGKKPRKHRWLESVTLEGQSELPLL